MEAGGEVFFVWQPVNPRDKKHTLLVQSIRNLFYLTLQKQVGLLSRVPGNLVLSLSQIRSVLFGTKKHYIASRSTGTEGPSHARQGIGV